MESSINHQWITTCRESELDRADLTASILRSSRSPRFPSFVRLQLSSLLHPAIVLSQSLEQPGRATIGVGPIWLVRENLETQAYRRRLFLKAAAKLRSVYICIDLGSCDPPKYDSFDLVEAREVISVA